MQTKDELKEITLIRQSINSKTRQIKELEAQKTTIKSPNITGLPRAQGFTNDNKIDRIIDKINALQELKAEQIDKLIDLENKYTILIAKLPSRHSLLLELRYFESKTWGEIAEIMHFDKRYTQKIHGRALENLRKTLENGH